MWPLVYEEADGMAVDGNLEDEVGRGPRLHCGSDHPVMVRVYQPEQVQHGSRWYDNI